MSVVRVYVYWNTETSTADLAGRDPRQGCASIQKYPARTATEFHQKRAAFQLSNGYIQSSRSFLKVTYEIIFTKTFYILVKNYHTIKAKTELSLIHI